MEDGAESSGSSIFPKHIREKSPDRSSIHEHSKSPGLLRKTDPETATLIAENRHRFGIVQLTILSSNFEKIIAKGKMKPNSLQAIYF